VLLDRDDDDADPVHRVNCDSPHPLPSDVFAVYNAVRKIIIITSAPVGGYVSAFVCLSVYYRDNTES